MFSKGNLQKLLAGALASVLRAGEIISEQSRGPLRIRYKGPTDLVTQTDLAVESFLRGELGALAPQFGFLGEEGAASGPGACGEAFWVVDPVDGTTNYAHGLPFVAVSAALWNDGRAVLGVVNCPFLGECYFAGRGLGAWLGLYAPAAPEQGGEESPQPEWLSSCNGGFFHSIRPLRVSRAAALQNALVATGFPYEISPMLPRVLRRLELVLPATRGLRRCGAAALDLAFVAAGRFDAYYEEGIRAWDVAAGCLIVEEAGGMTGNLSGEARSLHSPEIIAANPEIFRQLAALLRQAEA